MEFVRRLPLPMKLALFNEGTYYGTGILWTIWFMVWALISNSFELLIVGCIVLAIGWFITITWATYLHAHRPRSSTEPED